MYVSFTEYEYFVHENEGEVRVYLELFGVWKPIQTGIWIHVFTTDNTAIGEGWMEGGREGGRKCRGRKGGIEEGGIKEGGSTKLTLLEKKIFSLKMSLSFSPHSW